MTKHREKEIRLNKPRTTGTEGISQARLSLEFHCKMKVTQHFRRHSLRH